MSIFWDYYVGSEILNQPLYHLLGIGLVGVGKTAVLGGDEMADVGEGVFQLTNDRIFIVLVGQVVANGDVSTAHADSIECQGKDVAALAGSEASPIPSKGRGERSDPCFVQRLLKLRTGTGDAFQVGV